ncbi:MAG: hypothetical protein FJ040_01400 [Chloroflexi bacterium]|nr:hypothetical protein [Chloroflexota bacterium]
MYQLRHYGQILLLSILPFLVLNTIVSQQIQPMLGWMRPTGHTSLGELVVLGLSLMWAAYGAVRIILPMRRASPWSIVRMIGGLGLLTLVLMVTYGIGNDIYRCDIIHVPNCD